MILSLGFCLAALVPQDESRENLHRTQPWPAAVVELAGSLPVQDGGRVKPLSTYASFTLLRLNGKRSAATADGAKQSPTEWMLDLLFFPHDAASQPVFLVQDAQVIEALGLTHEGKKKRDRYSYEELLPGADRLIELAHEYSSIEEKDRSSVQQQVVNLAENVRSFTQVANHEALALIPPVVGVTADPEWLTIAEAYSASMTGQEIPEAHREILSTFGSLIEHRTDLAAFERDLGQFQGRIVSLAEARDEYGKVGLEITYYKAQLLTWSLVLFILAFFSVAFLWLRPQSRLFYGAASLMAFGGMLLLVAAIVLRCMIRSRPPVSTLYETVLFVTAVGSIVALFIEAVGRRRIAISAAAIVGVVGLFIANGYETLDKRDTMPSLVAVLDTNFWLSTHVTAITTGYSAGMLAALLASLYLLAKFFGWKRGDRAFYGTLGRMVYGVLCFGMIFATIGTILGGIWANESWGRFWGWDPKENGALLIVISQIAILHGRLGGYLREHGTCMAAALGGTVVAFSWWGVNLLGVGLHSYGFTSGIHTALWTYYGIQWGIVGLGGIAWLRERAAARALVPAAVSAEPVRIADGEKAGASGLTAASAASPRGIG